MDDPADKPLTASRLSPFRLKLTGKDQWKQVDALIFSSEYVPYQRNALAHYYVVYTYKIGEERYVGKFDDFSRQSRFERNGAIQVRFNPQRPELSYCPDQLTDTRFFVGSLIFGSLLGLVVILVNWF